MRYLGFLFVILVAACATTSGGRSLDARVAAAPTRVAKGQVLYEASCQRCHALYMPASFHADEWKFYLRKYGRRARIDKEQRGLVFEYLSANARGD